MPRYSKARGLNNHNSNIIKSLIITVDARKSERERERTIGENALPEYYVIFVGPEATHNAGSVKKYLRLDFYFSFFFFLNHLSLLAEAEKETHETENLFHLDGPHSLLQISFLFLHLAV